MSAAILFATIVVAFVAGVVALAMPCCFTVLLPSYLAKSFASKSGRLGMTTVFGAGIATVLLPIAMGVSYLSGFITLNHPLLFVVGGFFMIVLGLLTLWGVALLPSMQLGVDLQRKDVPSVYALGVFGGVASSCCAPVLAGVMVLTVISGTWLTALAVALAYVVGMVSPLLVVALLWDRRAVPSPRFLRGRLVTVRVLGLEAEIHSSKLIGGALFIAMGIVTIGLGLADRMLLNPGSEIFGIYQASLERALIAAFSEPLFALAAGVIVLVTIVVGIAMAQRSRGSRPELRPSLVWGTHGSGDASGDELDDPDSALDPTDWAPGPSRAGDEAG